MKTLTFKYLKKDGSVSDRTLMAYTEPNTAYEGIDVSELSHVAAAEFAVAMDAAYTEYLNRITNIKAAFDLTHNYRRFVPTSMSEVVAEHI